MIQVFVTIHVRPECLGSFVELINKHQMASRLETGCLRFDVKGIGNVYTLVEEFMDRAALESHRQTPHYANWRMQIGSLEALPRTHLEYECSSQKLVNRDWLASYLPLKENVVVAGGVFSHLHEGHKHLLQWANEQGDVLVVALNDDDYVENVKGNNRQKLCERASAIAELEYVDWIVPFSEDTQFELLRQIGYGKFVKGPDWADKVIGLPYGWILAIAPPSEFTKHTSDII